VSARGREGTGVGAPRSRGHAGIGCKHPPTGNGALEVAATPIPSRPRLARIFVVLLLAAAAPAVARGLDGRAFRVDGGRIVDRQGREITLRGVNARVDGVFDDSFTDGRLPLEPIPTFDAGDADKIRDFGFDVVRLPINWSGVEPSRGMYSKAYLDRVASVVDLCAARGILVLLDFHQDAFSKEIGQDGAPRWVLDLLLGPNGYPYLGGPLTDLGTRRLASYTLDAFRKFDANDQDVQTLYAKAIAVVAKRFRQSRAVVGYEIMNEPLATLDAAGDAELLALDTRVTKAIRRVDRRHLVFFEPNSLRNLLNQASIPVAPFPDRRAVYAPHIYTYVFDGKTYTGDNSALVDSMQKAASEAAAWGTPLFVGEYGIDPTNPLANDWIAASLDLQDQLRAGSTFWLWEEISSGHWGLFEGESSDPNGERPERIRALSRPYARAVPGRVVEHTVDPTTSTLHVRWQASGRGLVEIYVSPRRFPNGATIACDGTTVDATPDPVSHVARLRCGGKSGEHVVDVVGAS
jgi:endoglycosylceramidase